MTKVRTGATATTLARHLPGAERCNARAQLLCLRHLIDHDEALAVEHAWVGLSRACHHHAYELPPTAPELSARLDTIEGLLEATQALSSRAEMSP